MDIEITRGRLADVDALAPLWTAMVEHHRTVVAGRVPVRPAAESWDMRRREYASWLDDGSGLLFLARREAADEVIGYAVCRLLASGPTFDLGPVRGDVESLAVSPRARGAGVGTALLGAVRAELERRGCRHWSISVAADNAAAVRLYERVGFRPLVHLMHAPLTG
ncbi:GNAT family N-acetyltransferase [Pseudonocardia adelaidensis]|uniref:N-acetyltransferase domain-containing protein n=1 Tax=Pseudonocardia adelaidensis TaxID=648754 RepID=A0ABP9NFH6_9PSEU